MLDSPSTMASTAGPAPLKPTPKFRRYRQAAARAASGKSPHDRLVDPILHRDAKQFSTALGERQAQHGNGLNICNRIGGGVIPGKDSTGLTGCQRIRRQHHDRTP